MRIAQDFETGADAAVDAVASEYRTATEAGPVGVPNAGSRIVALVGGLVTGAALAAGAWLTMPGTTDQALASIARADIETAAQSLLPASAAALVEQAKACRRPLGEVTVVATGQATGRLRFISGTYVSPFIKLAATAERVAIPFPAPIEAGRGRIVVENEAEGADVFLKPGVRIPPGRTTRVLDVHWDPRSACR